MRLLSSELQPLYRKDNAYVSLWLKGSRHIIDIGFFNKALEVIRAALEGNASYYGRIESMANAEIGPLAFVKMKVSN